MMLSAIKNTRGIAFQTIEERSGTNVVSRAKGVLGSWESRGEREGETALPRTSALQIRHVSSYKTSLVVVRSVPFQTPLIELASK